MTIFYGDTQTNKDDFPAGAYDEMYGMSGDDKLVSSINAGAVLEGGSGDDYLIYSPAAAATGSARSPAATARTSWSADRGQSRRPLRRRGRGLAVRRGRRVRDGRWRRPPRGRRRR